MLNKKIKCLVLMGTFIGILFLSGIGCPIKFFFGVSCLGCGMTRACHSALHLDFAQAFHYHPLFLFLPAWLLLFWFWERLNQKAKRIILFSSVGLFIVVYVIRLCLGGDIVVINIKEGLIGRFLQRIVTFFLLVPNPIK